MHKISLHPGCESLLLVGCQGEYLLVYNITSQSTIQSIHSLDSNSAGAHYTLAGDRPRQRDRDLWWKFLIHEQSRCVVLPASVQQLDESCVHCPLLVSPHSQCRPTISAISFTTRGATAYL